MTLQKKSHRACASRPDRTRRTAQTETLDPLILSAKIVEPGCCCGCCCEVSQVPECIGCMFGDDIVLDDNVKKLYVTLGQFSIIRLERDIQLLMPAYDICMPAKECNCGSTPDPEDPCDMFERFEFPVDEFYPSRRDALETGGGISGVTSCGSCAGNSDSAASDCGCDAAQS